jgi:hypothetical protein
MVYLSLSISVVADESALPLLVPRIGRADDAHDAVAADDLAVAADFLDGG